MSRLDRMVLDIKGPADFRKLDRLPASMRFGAMIIARFKKGRLDMVLSDGRTLRFDGKEPGPQAEMIVHDDKFMRTVEPVYGKEKSLQALQRWWRIKELSATEMTGALSLLDTK